MEGQKVRRDATISGAHIVVVEDDESIQELLRYHLEKTGYNVDGYDRGPSGLRAIRDCLPNFVLLDLMLPGLDGVDSCRQMKADPSTQHIPIVMSSGITAPALSGPKDREYQNDR